MRTRHIGASLALIACLAGCTRFEPEKSKVLKLTKACPWTRGPSIDNFSPGGLRGVYQFVVQGASKDEMNDFYANAKQAGFGILALNVNMNGLNTRFATGPGLLQDQGQVDAEFAAACALASEHVYLTHVRHNSDADGEDGLRAR